MAKKHSTKSKDLAKPTHFTAKQIRETIQRTGLALSAKSSAKR
jgi:hypothetical protein